MEQFWNWILTYLDASFGISLMKEGNPQGYVNCVFMSLTTIFGILLAYRVLYLLFGIFGKSRKYKSFPDDKRYAFVFSARNEELVIGNLIDSVREQTYNQNNIDIIVVADNCNPEDKTAEIARSKGCLVYERHDLSKCRKGYALQYLFEKLKHDLPNGIETYYAYVFMDSDNVMAKDFLSKLNDAFQSGYDIATGYRNVKNADDNWLTALSAINWYRAVIVSLRARSMINSCAQIGGTGYGVRSYILKDGWDYTMITEDGEMTTRLMAVEPKIRLQLKEEDYARFGNNKLTLTMPNGKKVVVKARKSDKTDLEIPEKKLSKYGISPTTDEFGDVALGNPVILSNSQGETLSFQTGVHVSHYIRLGYVEAAQFFDEQPTTLKITIRQRIRWAKGGMVNWAINDWKLFFSFLRHPRWSKYDIYWEMFPYGLWNFFMGFFNLLITTILWATGASGNAVDGWANIWSYIINMTVIQYLGGLFTGIPVIIKEWDKVHFNVAQAIGYIFLWPFYDMIGTPISIACLFMHVTWKPVPHHVVKNGDELMEVHREKEAAHHHKR